MKRLLFFASLALAAATARAENVPLGTYGTFSIDLPAGWTLTSHAEEETGVAVVLTPPAGVNARGVLNVTVVVPPMPISKETIDEQVQSSAEQFVGASVEKTKTLRPFKVSSGYGAYCLFTDAGEVGKPATPEVYKNVVIGIIRLSESDAVAVSLLFDGEKGPELAALLQALSTARIETARH